MRNGLALKWPQYSKRKYDDAQHEAEHAGRGMWAGSYVKPWLYRVYEIDNDKILKACARHGVAIEVNAHPRRLDLDWCWHQKALDYGCILSINLDAHSIPSSII